jgi:uncharacterized protein (DUF1800 family)
MCLVLTAASFAWWYCGRPAAAQEPDVVAAVNAATAELTAADKVVVAARNALQAAKDNLDTTRFNSAAYNANITAQQLKAANEKHEKAEAKDKEGALELFELAQELAAQRKTELEAAEKVLPQREAEAKAAEEKYAAAVAAAEASAAQIKSLVRQTASDALTKLKDSKLAIEKAAVAKATAEQKGAANAQVVKLMADLVAADTALQQSAAAVQQAAEADRPQKLVEAENATKVYMSALHAVAQHLPPFKPDEAKPVIFELRLPLIEADKAVQKATAALQQAQQNLQSKVDAVKQAEDRVKAAQEGVAKRIAKTAAQKDLAREQEAAKRAAAAKVEAEQALPPIAAVVEKTQKDYAAALQAAVKSLIPAADAAASLAAEKAVIAKAMADKEAAIKQENEVLAREAAEAQAAAEKAQADLAAIDKLAADRVAVREVLERTLRQRFYREASSAKNEFRQHETALAAAQKDLQAKVAAVNKVAAALQPAKDNAAKLQKDAAAQVAVVTAAAKEKEVAEKSVQEKAAAKAALEQTAKEAQAALGAAQEALTKATAEEKAAAEKLVQEKDAAAQAAAQKVKEAEQATTAAQPALEKAVAALAAAEKQAADMTAAAKDAEQKATAAQAAVDTANAEKTAAEQVINQLRQAVESAQGRVTVARAAAYGGLKPLAESAWDRAKARHLLVRAGFGGTPEEVDRLHAMGLHRAVSHMVNFKNHPPAEVAFVAYAKERPESYEAALSGEEQRRLKDQRVAQDQQQIQNMRIWWLRRMIESPRPLEEKLTLFWHGQVPVQYSDVGDSYYMYLQNQMFRENAAGNFATLLHGIVHDAAMLKYLNNDTNIKGKANENLAREIMELFSMGRDQGYSEIDIRQGARALTGYTYDPATGQFRFISDRHDTEPKTIFGKPGNWCGDDFAQLILETPYPARFVARQMFTFFSHGDPSIDTVEALANVLQTNKYELTPMLENLFLSEEFYSAKSMSTEVKSPVQLVVGLHRDLGLKNPDYAYLASALREMGQDLFEPPSVFGWQTGRAWITTSRALSRYNVLAEILQQRPRGGQKGVDVLGTLLAGHQFGNHVEVVDYLVKSTWTVPLSESKRQALIEFLKPLPEPAQWKADPGPINARLTHLLVMLLCSPEYQLG